MGLEEKKKLKKDKKVKEVDRAIEEYDEKSLSKLQQVKKIVEVANKSEDISSSLANKLLNLFRIAIKISTDTEVKAKDDKKEEKEKMKGKDKEYSIILSSNPALYKEVVKTSVEKLPKMILKCFKKEIDLDTPTEDNYNKIKKAYATAHKTHTILMRSFIANYIKLLKGNAETQSVELFLVSLLDCVKLCFPFKLYRKKLIIVLVEIMCKYYETSSEAIVMCFDAIRKIIHWNKFIKEDLTNFAYKKFLNAFGVCARVGGAGASSSKTRENLRLLENCFCELLSVDYVAAYQVGFALIRKLSMICRSVRNDFNVKSTKRIVNWQYHHNLHLLSVVLYTLTLKSSELELLIYPYVQLCIATLGISQKNTKFFPYTLKICKMLNNLNSVSPDLYIPVAQYLLHLFTGTDDYLNRKTKPAKDALPNYEVAIKISKEFYEATETKDFIFKSCVQELKRHLEILKNSLSFPEAVIPICHTLGQFKRRCKNPPYYNVIRELYSKIRDVTDKVAEHRKAVDLMDESA